MKNLKLATSPKKAVLMIEYTNGEISNVMPVVFGKRYSIEGMEEGGLLFHHKKDQKTTVSMFEPEFPYHKVVENKYSNTYETYFYEITN